MADGTSVVSDRWGTSAGPRALRERSQYASRLRLPAAAENRRNCSQMSPCAGRLPSGRGPNADRPFDEPTTSTARRVAAATWMMSSTTVASRAYAVVPARRSRWSHGGASRPSSAPAAGSARHRADASRRDRAARSPDPQPASCRRSFRRGFRAARGSEHSTPPVSSAGPAASFGLRWSRCPCRSLRAKSWRRRCSSRSSSLSLICRASLDERKALASAKTASAAAHGAGLGRSMQGTPVRATSNVRPWNPVVTAIAGLPPFPRHRTRTPRECPEGSAPEGGTDRRCSAPFRGSAGRRKDAGTRWLGCCPPRNEHWRDAPAGKKAHE